MVHSLLSFILRKIKKPQSAVLIIILLLAAFMRLYRIRDYMTFLGDEGRDVLVVYRLLTSFDIPFIGPTASVGGFFLGPLYYYLMAPFLYLFRYDPVGPAVMVGIFGTATVGLLYWAGVLFFDKKAGLIAAFLYAISPLVIAQSRSSWNPNIVPFFALLLIISLYQSVKTKNSKHKLLWYLLSGICYGAGVQLHYLFLFLVPVGMVTIFLIEKRNNLIRIFAVASSGFLLLLIPFFGFEIKNNFPNLRSLLQFLSTGKEVSYTFQPFSTFADLLFRLYGRLLWYFPPPEQLQFFDKTSILFWRSAIIISIALSLIVLGYQLLKRNKTHIILFFWLFFGIGLFMFYRKAIYDYYFVIVFPLPFLLFANILSVVSRKFIGLLMASGVLFFVTYLNFSGIPFRSQPNRQLFQAETVARFAYEKAERKPFNFALITASNSDHAYRYFFEVWGNQPIEVKNTQEDPERTSVTDQLIVICEVNDCKPLGNSLWEIAGFGRAEIVGSWPVGVLSVHKLVRYSE